MKSLSLRLGIILIAGCLTLLVYEEGWGADWKLFAETDSYQCFYDVGDTTPSSKNIVDVLTKLEYTEKGITGVVKQRGKHYADLSYSLELWEIDCAEKKDRILSITEYSTEGKILYATSVQGRLPPWKIISKKSVDESLYAAVCK